MIILKTLTYLFTIWLICFNNLYSKELKNYNIAFIDVTDDPRYTKWGIHPVDIRSKFKKRKSPIDGALLAIEETRRIERLTQTKFNLRHIRLKNYKEATNFIEKESFKNLDAVLLDLNFFKLNKFKENIKKKKNVIFFNVSDPKNELRTKMCLENFFNTFPSYFMLTDSLSQYLVKKRWNKALLLTGPLEQDKEYSNSFKASASKYGIKVIDEKFFVNSNDPRIRDKNNLAYLTKGKKYNSVFVSDIDGEFSLSVPNSTMSPALVIGSAGLKPNAWHWSYLRHGAPQLNGRFERLNNRRMESTDWSAWISVKALAESVVRIKSKNSLDIINYLTSSSFQLDGSKGISLNFRSGTNQLRQTIFLTSSNNWVTEKIPLQDFQDSKNNLDTIGISSKKTHCSKKD